MHSKSWSQSQRLAVATLTRRTCETRKMANCFSLIKRITELKTVKRKRWSQSRRPVVAALTCPTCETGKMANCSKIQRLSRRIQHPTRQVFPEGLMSLWRTDMSNTLDQNCRCEFCCGMHQTKKQQHNTMRWPLYIYNHSRPWRYKTTYIYIIIYYIYTIHAPPAAT